MKFLKNIDEFLLESKHYQNLYHIVDYDKLKYILDNNKIVSKSFSNISLTRNKMMNGYLGDSPLSIFKLEIDANKLSHKYKIEPFSYKSHNGSYFNEYEERVLTQKIPNAFIYINKIILIKKNIERLKKSYRDDTDDTDVSDWFSENKGKNIPFLIKNIYDKCKEKGFDLYVQDGSIIKKDDEYINNLINYKLVKKEHLYASVLRGHEKIIPKGKKYGHYIDVMFDEHGNKLEDYYIGQEFNYEDIHFILNENKNELVKMNEKIINDEKFTPFIIKFLKKKNGILYLQDIRPF
jgi:hypothetical protein